MNISEIKDLLNQNIKTLCWELLPKGKKQGSEWVVGGVDGQPGKSMSVSLQGSKLGIWCDFATGESGDLIDLWCSCKNQNINEALPEIKDWLGVKDHRPVEKNYSKPEKPKCHKPKTHSPVLKWLYEERKINLDVIEKYKIAESGDYVIFPFLFDGEARMIKQRNIHDKKDLRPTSKNQEPCLFGWQAIPDNAREVTICEGELDALSLYQYGYPALSVPFGGGKGAKQNWIENEFYNLDRFEKIYLCMDSDSAGQEAVAEICDRLGSFRCHVVNLPHKDANECLKQSVPSIDKYFIEAKLLKPEEISETLSHTDNVIKLLHEGGYEPGFFAPWPIVKDKFYFRYGELSVLNGVNGHGKSQLAGQLLINAILQKEKVCIASMELTEVRLLKNLVLQAGGVKKPSEGYIRAIFDWWKDDLYTFELTGTAKADRLLEVFLYARKAYGCKVFVIDSLMKCGIGEDDYNGQKLFVDRLCDFKNKHGVHIFLVTHSRKGETEEKPTGKFDVKGTGAITDLADNVFVIWRNKKKERDLREASCEDIALVEEAPDSVLYCCKQRNGEWEGAVPMWFDPDSKQFMTGKDLKPFQYVRYSEIESLA